MEKIKGLISTLQGLELILKIILPLLMQWSLPNDLSISPTSLAYKLRGIYNLRRYTRESTSNNTCIS